jgi:hypothetical protein
MKRCPTCRRTFADDTLSFCLVDGSILSAPYDHQGAAIDSQGRSNSSPLTEFLPPERSKGKVRFVRYIIWAVFAVGFLVLNICLLVPMGDRGMSWEEAALGIVPGALAAFICFVLLLAGVGAKGGSRSHVWRFWMASLLWSLLIGGIVTYATTRNYEANMNRAYSARNTSDYGSSYSSLYEAYARYDQMGMMYGRMTLGFAGVSLLGLIISLAVRKRA